MVLEKVYGEVYGVEFVVDSELGGEEDVER